MMAEYRKVSICTENSRSWSLALKCSLFSSPHTVYPTLVFKPRLRPVEKCRIYSIYHTYMITQAFGVYYDFHKQVIQFRYVLIIMKLKHQEFTTATKQHNRKTAQPQTVPQVVYNIFCLSYLTFYLFSNSFKFQTVPEMFIHALHFPPKSDQERYNK